MTHTRATWSTWDGDHANLIRYIETHGCNAIPFRGQLLVTCGMTSLDHFTGEVLTTDHTETIPATGRAVRAWLGY